MHRCERSNTAKWCDPGTQTAWTRATYVIRLWTWFRTMSPSAEFEQQTVAVARDLRQTRVYSSGFSRAADWSSFYQRWGERCDSKREDRCSNELQTWNIQRLRTIEWLILPGFHAYRHWSFFLFSLLVHCRRHYCATSSYRREDTAAVCALFAVYSFFKVLVFPFLSWVFAICIVCFEEGILSR